jgi:hypothetical protein
LDEGKYQVENTDLVQGQNVGDHLQITQHFYGPGSKPAHPAPQEHIWNVPYRRNPFFTGREEVLNRLHEHYKQAKSVALTQPPAITGLGGIGKTQIAIEYAYRYRDDYQYVLWVNALSSETLLTEFITLADILELPQPEKDEHHQVRLTSMVKRWFSQHDHWLFILDNADNLPQVTPFLPTGDKGHILLTTRMSPTGTFTGLEVEKMDSEESMELLLGRAKFSLSEVDEYADQEALEALLKELDGLPLALGQAGAYIEETACTLVAYLKAYQQRRDELLQHRDELNADYPYTVTTTWSLNFEQIEGLDPLAADLLRFFAFLAPDAIPEEMIVESAVDLGTQIQVLAADATRLDKAIGILRRFSLVQRNREQRTISLHRLVQAVQKDSLDEDTQRLWAERVVLAVNRAFPDVDFLTWQRCQRCLPHALGCHTDCCVMKNR